ncbi:sigma factor-like helix-turn-helix DNA-binding protein [Undibacterium umbellatum]|uniref:RNA polymerase sigma-70 region 4 domain-containing protein n=1 Tax=Undibacterium umbellatum TaxID=2762300 RepID=A0ABR6ZHL9_9BURK|nr:sigma factor-like helix-turn-helix DNA-binding protein [Undibacterium umbellatum]MBC3911223.1 hypothetical protein [Undibacterium umbellatum]
MTDKYTLKINISGVDSLVNELIEEHLSAIESIPEHQTFTLSTLLSVLTEDGFKALQENKNFFALLDLFEFKKITKQSVSRIENDYEICPKKISDSNPLLSSDLQEDKGQFEIKLPNPNTSITDGNLNLPWNINKLITRLRNASRVRNISGQGYTNFKLGEVLSDVISLKEEDILRIEGIGRSYLNSLKQLHDLYKDFDPTNMGINERKSTTLNLDLTGLEIVKLGMSDDEVNFIDAMVDNEFDVSLKTLLNLELSVIKSLPLIGPAKREGFRTLKIKLLTEIEKIISGEIVLEKYESRLIRDSKIEVLDIEILDRVILEDLEEFLSKISPREVDIFQSRLGFIQEQLTLETLGKKYEIDRERVRQIERKCRDNFLDSMRINPEKIWILIRDQLDSSLPDRIPLTYDPFDSADCFYDFLSFISCHNGRIQARSATLCYSDCI